jgi:hypothetical protein
MSDNAEMPRERLTVRIPGRCHPHAPQPHPPERRETPVETHDEQASMDLDDDEADSAPQHIGWIHDFPGRSTCSGLVRNTGGAVRSAGGGAMPVHGAFENLEPAFTPTLSTPDA